MRQQTASVPMPTARELAITRQARPPRFNFSTMGAMTFLLIFTLYFLIPFFWLLVSATKSQSDLFGTFGLWFAPTFIFSAISRQALPSTIASFGPCRPIPRFSSVEAGRIDGAGEFRIFTTITLRLLTPALVTILLFGFVGIWTNFFLPLIMFSDPGLFPITVGLQSWNVTASNAGANTQTIYNLIVTGALVSSIPLLIGCIILQRFWRGGLGAGSVKG